MKELDDLTTEVRLLSKETSDVKPLVILAGFCTAVVIIVATLMLAQP